MPSALKPLVLVADDNESILGLMKEYLGQWDYRCVGVSNKVRLLEELAKEQPYLLLQDLHFGKDNGIELMKQIRLEDPELCVVILTGDSSIESAVTAIKLGAYDYVTKPIDWNRLRVVLRHADEKHLLSGRIKGLEQLVKVQNLSVQLLGCSSAMSEVRELIAGVAPTNATVLILGESGTGKELVARAIHEQSKRREAPFVPINMAALPGELVESTLFGHERGAFTGADRAEIGCCEAADQGTLFLDEIGEMDLRVQSKLLRFLQELSFQRVGSSRTQVVDVRVVAATNRDLQLSIARGQFREDLYYRLHVMPITVPPLREHREDIPVLAEHFRERAALRCGKEVAGFTEEALALLGNHPWPGNVRELENLVERLVILCRGSRIEAADLPAEFHGLESLPPATLPTSPAKNHLRRFEVIEKQAILDALQEVRGNVRQAARLLGLGQATVYRKMKRYAIVLNTVAGVQAESGIGRLS